MTIAARGGLSIPHAVELPIRVQDLEFRLAVEPPGGWFSKTRLVLEVVCVLAGAGLLCLLVNLLESRQAVEMVLAEANQRLLRETADKEQAQNEFRSARDESAATHAELDRTRAALQSSTTAELRLQVAARAAEEMAQARYVELEQLQASQQQAEQTIASLQARLNATGGAEKEASQALRTELEIAQATIADLQARLEAATRPAPEAAEPDAGKTQPTADAFHGPDAKSETMEAPQEANAAQAEEEAMAVSTPIEPASGPVPVTAPELDSAAPTEVEATPVPAAPPRSEASPARKSPRAPRRKKVQRNDQMDLFETQPAAVPAQAAPAVEAVAKDQPVESSPSPTVEPPAPSAAIAPAEPASPAADTTEEALAEPKPASKSKEEHRASPFACLAPGESRAAAQGREPDSAPVYGQGSRRARLSESQPRHVPLRLHP